MSALRLGQRRWRRWLYAGVTLVTAAFFSGFVVVGASAQIGGLTGSPSGFESGDGNMVLDATTANTNTDWNCFVGSGGFQSGTPNSNCKVTAGATQTWADGGTTSVGTNELQIVPGTKFDTACPATNTGSNPPKDEFTNVAEFSEFDSSGNLFFYGATIRPTTNGNSSGNVILAQNATATSIGCRTAGDVLIAFDFVNGGGTPALHTLTWISSGSCFVKTASPPCWGDENTVPSADFNGNVNTGTIAAGDNGISGTQLNANAFAEFGINLTAALKAAGVTNPNTCFAAEAWESRSSGSSFTSNPEDLELSGHPTCGKITIIKHTLNGAGNRTGINQDFSYTTTGGLTPSTFTLNDSSGTDGATNTRTYMNVHAGSYSVTEGTEPANFIFVGVSCTPTGSGTSTTTTGQTASITLGGGGAVVCTYTNQQQVGAIRINKTSSKAAATPLSGAQFFLCTNQVNSTSACTAPTDASGTTVSNPLTTDSSGTVCVGNLPLGQYFVFESAAPHGYAIDDSSAHSANVTASGDCSSSTSASVTLPFTDTPLTDITATATSEATGGTQSSITCVSGTATGGGANVGNSPQPSTGTSPSPSVSATGLKPGTYTCTITIDP